MPVRILNKDACFGCCQKKRCLAAAGISVCRFTASVYFSPYHIKTCDFLVSSIQVFRFFLQNLVLLFSEKSCQVGG